MKILLSFPLILLASFVLLAENSDPIGRYAEKNIPASEAKPLEKPEEKKDNQSYKTGLSISEKAAVATYVVPGVITNGVVQVYTGK